jgi:hypothetical protein
MEPRGVLMVHVSWGGVLRDGEIDITGVPVCRLRCEESSS